MSKEAMKLALEALQAAHLAVECDMLADEIQQAISALRETQAEQPAQPSKPWVGLEPGEISKIATSDQLAWANLNTVENRQYFARAIEAKLREKNT